MGAFRDKAVIELDFLQVLRKQTIRFKTLYALLMTLWLHTSTPFLFG
jgi:hypothetical protein